MYTLKINFVQLINIVRITVRHFNLHIHEYSFERLRRRRKWGKKKIRPPIWTSYPIPLNSVRCNVDFTQEFAYRVDELRTRSWESN